MEQCILLTHVFIREGEKDKLESVEFAMKHWRQHNPDAFIIVTGHGVKPNIESYCNEMIWFPNIIEKEIGKGHPHLVTKGLDIAERKGFEHILKSRCDTIHNKKDIFSFAKSLLQADKKLLVTQQTSLKKQELGDLFLYGSIELMKKIFNVNNWYPTKSGLNSLANNLLAHCDEGSWAEVCKNRLQLVDIFKLRWIDFRSNWQELKNAKTNLLNFTLDNEHNYYWGAKEKWHVWNLAGECIEKIPHVAIEKEWYK